MNQLIKIVRIKKGKYSETVYAMNGNRKIIKKVNPLLYV